MLTHLRLLAWLLQTLLQILLQTLLLVVVAEQHLPLTVALLLCCLPGHQLYPSLRSRYHLSRRRSLCCWRCCCSCCWDSSCC